MIYWCQIKITVAITMKQINLFAEETQHGKIEQIGRFIGTPENH